MNSGNRQFNSLPCSGRDLSLHAVCEFPVPAYGNCRQVVVLYCRIGLPGHGPRKIPCRQGIAPRRFIAPAARIA